MTTPNASDAVSRAAADNREALGQSDPLRPEVFAFALLMEKKLRDNEAKGGWLLCGKSYLTKRLREEADELAEALVGMPGDAERIREEAADVANFAMMMADNWGELKHCIVGSVDIQSANSFRERMRHARQFTDELLDEIERLRARAAAPPPVGTAAPPAALPATKCSCGLHTIGENIAGVNWYWQRHSRDACTLQLPNERCWCGRLRSEHIDGHAPPAERVANAASASGEAPLAVGDRVLLCGPLMLDASGAYCSIPVANVRRLMSEPSIIEHLDVDPDGDAKVALPDDFWFVKKADLVRAPNASPTPARSKAAPDVEAFPLTRDAALLEVMPLGADDWNASGSDSPHEYRLERALTKALERLRAQCITAKNYREAEEAARAKLKAAEAEREALRAEVAAEKRAHLRSREWLDHHAIQFARIRAVCGMHDESEETVEEAVENLAEERNALEVERDAATTEAATLRGKLEAAERDNVRHVVLLAQTANAFSIADEPSSFEAIPGKVRALKKERDEQRARADAAEQRYLSEAIARTHAEDAVKAAEAKLAALETPVAAADPEKCPVDAAYLERWRHGIVDTADRADEAPYIGQVRAMARALAWCADEIQRLSGGAGR